MLAQPALGARHRSDPEDQERAVVGRGAAPNVSASSSTACTMVSGGSLRCRQTIVEQPRFAERLARVVPGVDQPVGPEHQQVVAHAQGTWRRWMLPAVASPSGGAVASSRSGSPKRGTRKAYGWPALA